MSQNRYENPTDQARDAALAERGLPPIAYADNSKRIYGCDAQIIAIKRGEAGFYPIYSSLSADELNTAEGVDEAQREAMLAGSMFGWHLKGADPEFQRTILGRSAARAAACSA